MAATKRDKAPSKKKPNRTKNKSTSSKPKRSTAAKPKPKIVKVQLLPCPFCGGEIDIDQTGESEHGHYLYCNRCGACGPDWIMQGDRGAERTANDRAKAWNQRDNAENRQMKRLLTDILQRGLLDDARVFRKAAESLTRTPDPATIGREVVTFAELKRWLACDSPKLVDPETEQSRLFQIGDRRQQYVGIGMIDVGPADGTEVLVVDNDGSVPVLQRTSGTRKPRRK